MIAGPKWATQAGHGTMYCPFKKAENNERGANDYHGDDGPLSVSNMRIQRPITDAWVEAAQAAGYPFNPDYNGETQEGVGFFQLTSKNGRRCSTAVAYLNPARSRSNCRSSPMLKCKR